MRLIQHNTFVSGLLQISAAALLLSGCHAYAQEPLAEHKTKNVVVVMLDGMRWEEVFRGADPGLMNKKSPRLLGASRQRTSMARELYWRENPADRREVLMPFIWNVMARQGQIFGNRDLGSDSHVKNHHKFSYPGYNETLTGSPDDRRIKSNRDLDNPNITVFEWINSKPNFRDRVAAFGAWNAFKGIFNSKRCGFTVNAGYDTLDGVPLTPELALLNQLKKNTPHVWSDEAFDPLPFYTALEYMKVKKPRLLFIGLGETDDWAHMGAYPEYLNAAHRDDEYLRELWTVIQSMPEYRDQTTLIVLPDHGRGSGMLWPLHAWPVAGSGQTWMAFMGPDTSALGEREMTRPVTESQIAATVAAFLGEDYSAEVPQAGKPILEVLANPERPTVHGQFSSAALLSAQLAQ